MAIKGQFTVTSVKAMMFGKDEEGNVKFTGRKRDPSCNNFYLWVRKNPRYTAGSDLPEYYRAFQYRFEMIGKAYEITRHPFGSIDKTTLAEARAKADEYTAMIRAGINPALVKPEPVAVAKTITLREEAIEYQARNAPRFDDTGEQVGGWDQAYHTSWMKALEKHVLVHLGDRDSGQITGVEIANVLRPIWAQPVGFKVATILSAVYGRAVKLQKNANRLIRNPMGDCFAELSAITQKEREKQVKSHGMMTPDQVAVLYSKTAASDGLPAKALQLVLVIGCVRANEVLGMRWDEIVGDLFHVPGSRTKSGNPRTIPLVAEAMQLLASLPRTSEFVFPACGRREPPRFTKDGRPFKLTGLMKHDAMLDWLQENHPGIDAETGKKWDVHGLRHAYTTWVKSWAPMETYWHAEFGLDHVNKDQTQTQRVYDRAKYLPERRAILGKWAAHLTRPPVVVALHDSARVAA